MKYVTHLPYLAAHYYARAVAAGAMGDVTESVYNHIAAAAYQRSESYRRVWWYPLGPAREMEMDEAEFS